MDFALFVKTSQSTFCDWTSPAGPSLVQNIYFKYNDKTMSVETFNEAS